MKILLLASGGRASTVVAYQILHAGHTPILFFVDFGQAEAEQEKKALLYLANRLRNHPRGKLTPIFKTNRKKSGFQDYLSQLAQLPNFPDSLHLLSLLAEESFEEALQNNCGEIQCGLSGYQPGWEEEIDLLDLLVDRRAIALGKELHFIAPLLMKDKAEICEMAGKVNADLSHIWSCKFPRGGKPCEICNSCISEKSETFKRYIYLLRKIHRAIREGWDESEEANAFREEMDLHWRKATSEERAQFRKASLLMEKEK